MTGGLRYLGASQHTTVGESLETTTACNRSVCEVRLLLAMSEPCVSCDVCYLKPNAAL